MGYQRNIPVSLRTRHRAKQSYNGRPFNHHHMTPTGQLLEHTVPARQPLRTHTQRALQPTASGRQLVLHWPCGALRCRGPVERRADRDVVHV